MKINAKEIHPGRWAILIEGRFVEFDPQWGATTYPTREAAEEAAKERYGS